MGTKKTHSIVCETLSCVLIFIHNHNTSKKRQWWLQEYFLLYKSLTCRSKSLGLPEGLCRKDGALLERKNRDAYVCCTHTDVAGMCQIVKHSRLLSVIWDEIYISLKKGMRWCVNVYLCLKDVHDVWSQTDKWTLQSAWWDLPACLAFSRNLAFSVSSKKCVNSIKYKIK